MITTFTNFATIADPAAVRTSLLFACANIWRIDESAIEREIDAANVTVWAPIACRALGIDGGSWNALNSYSQPMRELCETANAIVAVMVGRHPEAFDHRFEEEVNSHVLGFASRMAA